MKSVIYADDMEPITIVDVPIWVMDMNLDIFNMAIIDPPMPVVRSDPVPDAVFKMCRIRVEWILRKGRRHPLFIALDDELALMLRPEYLAGQIGDMRAKVSEAFMAGIVAALRGLS